MDSGLLQNLPVLGIVKAVVLLSAPVYLTGWVIYARFFHPYADMPGPFWASMTRLWVAYLVWRGDYDTTLIAMHKKYGKFVRLAPDEVSISDPSAIQTIYSIKSGFTKTDFYTPFAAGFSKHPDLFAVRDEKIHAERRRLVNHAYSMSSILESETFIDGTIELFMKRLDEISLSGETVDFGMWLQYFAFDIVGTLFFGKMFGFLEMKGDHGTYIQSLDTYLPVLATNFVLPDYLRGVLPCIGNLGVASIRASIASIIAIRQAAYGVVEEREASLKAGKRGRNDVLDKLFKIQSEKDPELFGRDDIVQDAYVAIFAGSDTTAIAMRSIFYHLIRDPRSYNKLMAELDSAFKHGRLSSPIPTYAEATKMPYLSAVMKEGMRIHPSVGMTLPRAVPKEGREIAGRFFAGGSRVGICAAVVHQDQGIFGKDAAVFNPDRWLERDAVNMDRYMFQFGGGSRSCIGKNVSLAEMFKMIPLLLHSYNIKLVNPEREWTTQDMWFNKPTGIDVTLSKRVVA